MVFRALMPFDNSIDLCKRPCCVDNSYCSYISNLFMARTPITMRLVPLGLTLKNDISVGKSARSERAKRNHDVI